MASRKNKDSEEEMAHIKGLVEEAFKEKDDEELYKLGNILGGIYAGAEQAHGEAIAMRTIVSIVFAMVEIGRSQ